MSSFRRRLKLLSSLNKGTGICALAATIAAASATITTTTCYSTTASEPQPLKTRVCIIGSGPAAHTAAIYAGRAGLRPVIFEGFMANDLPPGGQLTSTTQVHNFPGFPSGVSGTDLTSLLRSHSLVSGALIITDTASSVDLSRPPFLVSSPSASVLADSLIVATGSAARRLGFPGSELFWNHGISACAVCDGPAPLFHGRPVAVVGGGDSAMEEAIFLTRYASKVYIIHRRGALRASKIMQDRVMADLKIKILWNSEVVEAFGDGNRGVLGGLKLRNVTSGEVAELEVSGLFFAVGHIPATEFLGGQLELDSDGYIVTKPGMMETSVRGVFAAGDVQDKKYRQAITAAGSGCMAALDAERYLQELEDLKCKSND